MDFQMRASRRARRKPPAQAGAPRVCAWGNAEPGGSPIFCLQKIAGDPGGLPPMEMRQSGCC
jgi:hypothetical protein